MSSPPLVDTEEGSSLKLGPSISVTVVLFSQLPLGLSDLTLLKSSSSTNDFSSRLRDRTVNSDFTWIRELSLSLFDVVVVVVVFVVVVWFLLPPTCDADCDEALSPSPVLPPGIPLLGPAPVCAAVVDAKTLGASLANTARMAGRHAQMTPTQDSTMDQMPTARKSSVARRG